MATLQSSKYNTKGNIKYSFVEYPSANIFKEASGNKWSNHLLFGDYVKVLDLNIVNNRVYVRSRNTNGWINISELRKDRILEVNFIDIGQGDGCHIITPDDKHLLIDAGKSDNMIRYLSWRFNLINRTSRLDFPLDIIISHSDSDHYQGLSYVFDERKIRIEKIYHNGLVERPGANRLGKELNGFLIDIIQDTNKMKEIILNPDNRKGQGSLYSKTLHKSLKYNSNVDFEALSIDDEYLDDYKFHNDIINAEFSIKILAPIKERINNKLGLRTINDLGKDKNGHSVVVKVAYGNAKILLGGDVNEEFGMIISDYYSTRNLLSELRVDVAKACHHGSNHFDYDFIKSINAIATVISSGDDESYSHPRPDAIGTFGKCGYGEKPLIFSTELARSNKDITMNVLLKLSENIKKIEDLKNKLREILDNTEKIKIQRQINKLNKETNSFLTKYGMINLRTDGSKMIIAQKYERASPNGKWDIHKLLYSSDTNRFELVE